MGVYWMVLGSGRPTVRHTSEAYALAEAKRLAAKTPGSEFVVLKAVATCKVEDPVKVERLREEAIRPYRIRSIPPWTMDPWRF